MYKKDYYSILGIERDADHNEIRRAYRKLAFLYHPDTNDGDQAAEEKFKEVNEAYDVLGHDDKRARYDAGRDSPFGHGPGFGAGPGQYDSFFSAMGGWPGGGFGRGFRGMGGCRGGGFGRAFRMFRDRQTSTRRTSASPDSPSGVFDRSLRDLPLSAQEAEEGTQRDIRLHTGSGIHVFTITIPPGVKDHTVLKISRNHVDEIGTDIYFRVKIED
ncbi:MAG: DnaJ domain-containing protein [Desulfatiglandales bacterium]